MTARNDRTLTSSGFYVSAEAPIQSDNPVATPQSPPPDILRCAYMELVVTDLAASRDFYVDVLGLTVTGTALAVNFAMRSSASLACAGAWPSP